MSGIMLSNPLGAMIDKTKGNVQNRTKCAGAHLVNGAKMAGGVALGVTASAVAGVSLADVGRIKTTLKDVKDAKGFDKFLASISLTGSKIATKLEKSKLTGKVIDKLSTVFDKGTKAVYRLVNPRNNGKFVGIDKWTDGLLKTTKSCKAGVVAMAAGFVLTAGIALAKFRHKRGQIDQKYTDIAKEESGKSVKEKDKSKMDKIKDAIGAGEKAINTGKKVVTYIQEHPVGCDIDGRAGKPNWTL